MTTTFLATSPSLPSSLPSLTPRWSPPPSPYPRGSRASTPPQSALLLRRLRNDPILQLVADIGKQLPPARGPAARRAAAAAATAAQQARSRMSPRPSLRGPREVGESASSSRSRAVFRTPVGVASRRIVGPVGDPKSASQDVVLPTGSSSSSSSSSSFSTSSTSSFSTPLASSSTSSSLTAEPIKQRTSGDHIGGNPVPANTEDLIMSPAP